MSDETMPDRLREAERQVTNYCERCEALARERDAARAQNTMLRQSEWDYQKRSATWKRVAKRAANERDAAVAALKAYEARLENAVNASCTCGGGATGECCPACDVWHKMRVAK